MDRWIVYGGATLTVVLLTLGAAGFVVADEHDGPSGQDGDGPARDQSPDKETTRYIVGLEDIGPAGGAETHQEGDRFHGATVTDRSLELDFLVVETDDPERFTRSARDDPDVRYVEADPLKDLLDQFEPNDPLWSDEGMYGARQVQADHVWTDWLGGEAASVCVVDTGVRYTHEDLTGDRWLGGYDYWNDDSDPMDDNGHGTHVAGTAAASIDNGKGIAGIGNVGLYGVKVLNRLGGGYWSDIAKGITWCADNGGEDTVINLSLGAFDSSNAVEEAIEDAWEEGALVVSSAGNSGPCSDCVTFPADHPLVVTVSCTNSQEDLCWFSSTGPEVDLAAPGNDILSTCYGSDTSYCEKRGTSMSSPHVSGVAALAWSAAPCATPQELRDTLNRTAKDLGPAGWDTDFGHGRVDAHALFDDGLCEPIEAYPGPEPGQISLEWTLMGFLTESQIESFEIHRSDAPTGPFETIATLDTDTFTYIDTGLGDGETWYYKVLAVTADGAMESDVVDATTFDVPGPPQNVSALPGPAQGEITIEWHPGTAEHPDKATSDGEAGDTGTLISFSDRSGLAPIEVSYRYCYLGDTNGDAAYIDTYVDGERVDSLGFYEPYTGGGGCDSSDPSTFATHTFTVAETDLSDEIRFDYTNGDWRVAIADVEVDGLIDPDPPIDDGGTPITEYRVYEIQADGQPALIETTATDNKVTLGGMEDGAAHIYEVTAVNRMGEGPASDPDQTRTYETPKAPPELEASREQVGPVGTGIHLAWEPAPQPAWAPVDTYRVYRGVSPDNVDTFVGEVPGDEHAFTDTPPPADPPRNYYYAVRGENLIGEGDTSPVACTARGPAEQLVADAVAACFEEGVVDPETIPTTELETLYQESFDDGDADDWERSDRKNDLWRVGHDCITPYDGTHQLTFSRRSPDCDYDVGIAIGWIQSPLLDVGDYDVVQLEFAHLYEVEPWVTESDVLEVQVSDDGGTTWNTVESWDSRSHTNGVYHTVRFDVSTWASHEFHIRYWVNTIDGLSNDYLGWYVDAISLEGKQLG